MTLTLDTITRDAEVDQIVEFRNRFRRRFSELFKYSNAYVTSIHFESQTLDNGDGELETCDLLGPPLPNGGCRRVVIEGFSRQVAADEVTIHTRPSGDPDYPEFTAYQDNAVALLVRLLLTDGVVPIPAKPAVTPGIDP